MFDFFIIILLIGRRNDWIDGFDGRLIVEVYKKCVVKGFEERYRK